MSNGPVSTWRRRCLLLGALTAFSVSMPALAEIDPSQPAAVLKHKKPWFQWLAGTGIIAIVSLAAFKNAKRSK